RMIQRSGGNAVESLDAIGRVPRVGHDALALGEHARIERGELRSKARVLLAVGEITVRRAVEIVRGAVLVDQPDHLARMPREPGREARGDQQVDRPRVAARQVEHPPGGGLPEQLVFASVKRERDALGFVSALPQLRDERLRVELRAIAGKRHTGFRDHNSHWTATLVPPRGRFGSAVSRSTTLSHVMLAATPWPRPPSSAAIDASFA